MEHAEAVAQRCSAKNFSYRFRKIHRKTPVAESFLQVYQKETPAQVFSFEFCETSYNSFSYRTPPVVASEHGKSD